MFMVYKHKTMLFYLDIININCYSGTYIFNLFVPNQAPQYLIISIRCIFFHVRVPRVIISWPGTSTYILGMRVINFKWLPIIWPFVDLSMDQSFRLSGVVYRFPINRSHIFVPNISIICCNSIKRVNIRVFSLSYSLQVTDW